MELLCPKSALKVWLQRFWADLGNSQLCPNFPFELSGKVQAKFGPKFEADFGQSSGRSFRPTLGKVRAKFGPFRLASGKVRVSSPKVQAEV